MVSVRRDLGQNIFTVAFDIERTAEGYEYETAELPPGVWRRDLIISAIIRAKYSADDMEAIMNNVLGDISSKKARDEHRAMQQWRMKAKQWATELMQWAQDNGMAVGGRDPGKGRRCRPRGREGHGSAGTVPALD